MNEIINFVKGIITGNENERTPIGLCGFECEKESEPKKTVKPKRKTELRLSELMES